MSSLAVAYARSSRSSVATWKHDLSGFSRPCTGIACVSTQPLARERDRHAAGRVGARLSRSRGGEIGAPSLSPSAARGAAARYPRCRCSSPHMEMSVERRRSPMLVVVVVDQSATSQDRCRHRATARQGAAARLRADTKASLFGALKTHCSRLLLEILTVRYLMLLPAVAYVCRRGRLLLHGSMTSWALGGRMSCCIAIFEQSLCPPQ
ncbi:hypothetical protein Dimus_028485 [Dionaea muscipula]